MDFDKQNGDLTDLNQRIHSNKYKYKYKYKGFTNQTMAAEPSHNKRM